MDTTAIVLVGIGGYGRHYAECLLESRDRPVSIVGVVDPCPPAGPLLETVKACGIPLYPDLAAFYAAHRADLAVISSPIQFHCEQSCKALTNESHVLCEKPAAGSLADALRMAAISDAERRVLAIGYQWSFSESVHMLKADIMAGRLGRPVRLKTLVLWPRPAAYYARNRWAGRLRDDAGRWVLDSPVNNATAHYLHNMYYLLGDRVDASARPVRVTAETYRAKPIENYDTAAVRSALEGDAEILFYSSHSVAENCGPIMDFEFELGRVRYPGDASDLVVTWKDGTSRSYGNPDNGIERKLWDSVAAARGERCVACPIGAALAHARTVEAITRSSAVHDFPAEHVRLRESDEESLVWVEGLAETMRHCFADNVLPSEADTPWAVAGKAVPVPA